MCLWFVWATHIIRGCDERQIVPTKKSTINLIVILNTTARCCKKRRIRKKLILLTVQTRIKIWNNFSCVWWCANSRNTQKTVALLWQLLVCDRSAALSSCNSLEKKITLNACSCLSNRFPLIFMYNLKQKRSKLMLSFLIKIKFTVSELSLLFFQQLICLEIHFLCEHREWKKHCIVHEHRGNRWVSATRTFVNTQQIEKLLSLYEFFGSTAEVKVFSCVFLSLRAQFFWRPHSKCDVCSRKLFLWFESILYKTIHIISGNNLFSVWQDCLSFWAKTWQQDCQLLILYYYCCSSWALLALEALPNIPATYRTSHLAKDIQCFEFCITLYCVHCHDHAHSSSIQLYLTFILFFVSKTNLRVSWACEKHARLYQCNSTRAFPST